VHRRDSLDGLPLDDNPSCYQQVHAVAAYPFYVLADNGRRLLPRERQLAKL
jgi:hypothetical protein